MPTAQQTPQLILTQVESLVILRIRQLTHGSVIVKVQDGVPVFLQKVEDTKLV